MPYNFGYAVNDKYSGNDYNHQQSSDGKSTRGSYKVLLPDTRVQLVNFDCDVSSTRYPNIRHWEPGSMKHVSKFWVCGLKICE